MSRKLWTYQQECVEACLELGLQGKGQVILPTGTGKTVISLAVMHQMMQKKKQTITAVFAPRLLLLAQWSREIAEFLAQKQKVPIALVCVHSGNVSNKARTLLAQSNKILQLQSQNAQHSDAAQGNSKLGAPPIPEATTCAEEIKTNVQDAIDRGYHVIILCTYHSSQILEASEVDVDLALYDESHYLVPRSGGETKFRNALDIAANNKVFLTATPVHTDSDEDGLGMQNTDVFGEKIYTRSPKEMIEIGAIVGPLIHQVIVDEKAMQAIETAGDNEQIDAADYESTMHLIYSAWQRHKDAVKQSSANPDRIGAKLLVVAKDQKQLENCFETQAMKTLRREQPNLRLFGLSTDFGVYIDGEHHKPSKKGVAISSKYKEELLDELQYREESKEGFAPNDDAIIFHVNMIGEGLDVPGITGVLFLRNCDLILFLQNLGRACRLHVDDRTRIYESGELDETRKDLKLFVKPNCYVILPWCIEWNGADFLARFQNIVEGLRSYYDIDDITTKIVTDFLNTDHKETVFDEVVMDLADTHKTILGEAITEYVHHVEQKQIDDDNQKIKNDVVKLDDENRIDLIAELIGKDPNISKKKT